MGQEDKGGEFMYFRNRGLLCFTLFLIMSSFPLQGVSRPQSKEPQNKDKDIEEIIVSPKECLQMTTPTSPSTQPMRLQFVNTCQDDVYAKVCVLEQDGDVKLHKSPVRIPRFGTFNLMLYPGEEPSKVTWTSSVGEPPTPAPCNKNVRR
ncbi:MAG TPA: hypothetical protein VIH61_05845 [Waddliaceae bacterium]